MKVAVVEKDYGCGFRTENVSGIDGPNEAISAEVCWDASTDPWKD